MKLFYFATRCLQFWNSLFEITSCRWIILCGTLMICFHCKLNIVTMRHLKSAYLCNIFSLHSLPFHVVFYVRWLFFCLVIVLFQWLGTCCCLCSPLGGCGGFFFDGFNWMLGECCLSSCCSVSMQQQQQLRYHFQLALDQHLSNQVHSKTNMINPFFFLFSYKRLLSGSTTMDILRKKSSYIGHKGNTWFSDSTLFHGDADSFPCIVTCGTKSFRLLFLKCSHYFFML